MAKRYTAEEHTQWLAAQPKKVIGVKAVLKSENGNILLLKPNYKDTWQFPGGVVDAGESPEVGLSREIREETGLNIPAGDLDLVGSVYIHADETLILIYECIHINDENRPLKLQPEEIEDFGYFKPELLKEKLPGYYGEFLKRFNA